MSPAAKIFDSETESPLLIKDILSSTARTLHGGDRSQIIALFPPHVETMTQKQKNGEASPTWVVLTTKGVFLGCYPKDRTFQLTKILNLEDVSSVELVDPRAKLENTENAMKKLFRRAKSYLKNQWTDEAPPRVVLKADSARFLEPTVLLANGKAEFSIYIEHSWKKDAFETVSSAVAPKE